MKDTEESILMTEGEGGELISDCCGGSPASEPMEDEGMGLFVALCSICKDWADFEYEEEYDEVK